ncbi:helix-turn-helix transcriptional regulator [Pseudooceanicola marinus]|uniref:helix-turn-helix transcriptional regulator n=1 Tax=Pseudooceanicola marinus TaxID=396013 RepID=UPI001CD70F46|nr:AraC family transcriptional regulator [Pseudooceanicola marinus]MCA1336893.1 AraC family transcriptional regulator [Pseudooceanicola marinus]
MKGLWRQEFGGTEQTLRNVFATLRAARDRYPHFEDPQRGFFSTRVELAPRDGSGWWHFLSLDDRIFCVITEVDYAEARVEAVQDEGFVEFHFLLEGPVNLSLPSSQPDTEGERAVGEATLIACRNAGDVNYKVQCPQGPFRMIGLYVDPDLLQRDYEFTSDVAEQLLSPGPGEISIVEKSLNVDFVRALQHLRANPLAGQRDATRAAAKLQELLCLTVEELEKEVEFRSALTFSQRELEMFEQARDKLSTDFSTHYTVPVLARELGTNATKLKRGFKFLYGKTIFDFRKAYRMDHAMQLLRQRDMSVAEVAREVGYERQASFTAAFKAHFGVLPKTARQLQMEGDGEAG